MTSIYLDTNVLIDICEGRRERLKRQLLLATESGTVRSPFSAEQVEELTAGVSKTTGIERLTYLSTFARDCYFRHSAHQTRIERATAFDVVDELNPSFGTNYSRLFTSIVPFEAIQYTREAYGIAATTLNNLSPIEAERYINQALSRNDYGDYPEQECPRSLSEAIQLLARFWREHNEGLWREYGLNPEQMMKSFETITLFNMLDTFGFWADKRNIYEKGSGQVDAQHTFIAGHYDYLVSADRRMRMKAEFVYYYLEQTTRVISPEHLEGILEKVL